MTWWRAPLAATAAVVTGLLGVASATAEEPRTAPASVGADGRVSVAVVAPIAVPVTSPGLLTDAQLTRLTASDGLLTQELDGVIGQPAVALAIDPRIIASIRVLGSSAPASASAWLERLAAAPNQTFPLLYADADPVLTAQAGASIDLAPIDFSYTIDPDDFSAPVPTASPTPTSTPAAGSEPPLPQTPSQVLQWDWRFDDIVWPAADTVTTADLPRLAAGGYHTVLLSDGNVSGAAGHVRLTDEGAPAGLSGLVVESELSDAVAAVADSDSPGAEGALSGLTAATQAVAADSRGATRVVALPRSSAASSLRFLPAAITALQAAGADVIPLSAALDSDTGSAALTNRSEPEDRTAAVPSIIGAVAADDAFSSVAAEPLAVRSPRRLDLLALLSTGWIDDGAWTSAVTKFIAASTKLRDSVTLATSQDEYRGVGANVPIPVTVRNQLDTPIRVYAIVRPLRAALSIPPDRRRVAIAVQPDSTSTVRVPTQSVGNGRVPVQISLVSTSGVTVDQPTTITIDVQAGWETVGTLVALVLVLGVFGFGVTRNVLRRRAVRRGAGTDARG